LTRREGKGEEAKKGKKCKRSARDTTERKTVEKKITLKTAVKNKRREGTTTFWRRFGGEKKKGKSWRVIWEGINPHFFQKRGAKKGGGRGRSMDLGHASSRKKKGVSDWGYETLTGLPRGRNRERLERGGNRVEGKLSPEGEGKKREGF